MPPSFARRAAVPCAVALLLAATACSGSHHRAAAKSTTTTTTTSTTPTTTRPTSTSCCATSTTNAPTTTPTTRACVDPATWSTAQLAGQVIAVPAYDFDVDQLGRALRQGVGGVLFIGPAAAPSDLASRVAAANRLATSPGGLLTMADEEGGGVSRMAPLTSPVPWPRTMAATMTTGQVRNLAATVGRQMRAAGVRLDLAPVVDLDDQPGPSSTNPDGKRSFSNDPNVASAYARAFASGLADGGEGSTLKHFPGLGHSSGNTDVGPAHTLPLATLRAGAIPAFAPALPTASAVMVANASVPGLTTGPASLSSAAIDGLLRGQLGWHGLVVTDSLSAGAVSATGLSLPSAAAQSIEAGADLVLFGSTLTPADTEALSPEAVAARTTTIVGAVTQAVADGRLPRSRLEEAARHVLAVKAVAICP